MPVDPVEPDRSPRSRRPVGGRLARLGAGLVVCPPTANDNDPAKLLADDLRDALSHDRLSLFYQPVVDLANGAVAGFTASLRWFHPIWGEIHHDRIVAATRDADAAEALTTAVLSRAASAASRWRGYGFVAVPVPSAQVCEAGFAQAVLRMLQETGLPPTRLLIEVAGGASATDPRRADKALTALRAAGIAVGLRDVAPPRAGSGAVDADAFGIVRFHGTLPTRTFSGLANARRSPLRLGPRRRITVIADGLDTADQVRTAREAGCTHGRGDALGRALPMLACGAHRLDGSGLIPALATAN